MAEGVEVTSPEEEILLGAEAAWADVEEVITPEEARLQHVEEEALGGEGEPTLLAVEEAEPVEVLTSNQQLADSVLPLTQGVHSLVAEDTPLHILTATRERSSTVYNLHPSRLSIGLKMM
ncbi:hypothetical protein PHLCEN_2v13202 [Hermanssonia centrifuga]|uniref:Uncharacterized protein n=1 Tax=Hermanssonia centrifuga TaxID=98765 RepID=A0A2R6NEX0_9APHY|nr:hypothetical protein PHLCEN_2v13202 [Hermanssonia centrifuga]